GVLAVGCGGVCGCALASGNVLIFLTKTVGTSLVTLFPHDALPGAATVGASSLGRAEPSHRSPSGPPR
ncbi:MAG: hypothetical protein AN484_27335, partial [Aphanizomenon flos-aquae WA102]